MIVFRYVQECKPPTPYMYVTFANPMPAMQYMECAARIDTVADCTVLPQALVDTLKLEPIGAIQASGFEGRVIEYPTYRVNIAPPGFAAVAVEVISSQILAHPLLGLDFLNTMKLTFDGPNLKLLIEQP